MVTQPEVPDVVTAYVKLAREIAGVCGVWYYPSPKSLRRQPTVKSLRRQPTVYTLIELIEKPDGESILDINERLIGFMWDSEESTGQRVYDSHIWLKDWFTPRGLVELLGEELRPATPVFIRPGFSLPQAYLPPASPDQP